MPPEQKSEIGEEIPKIPEKPEIKQEIVRDNEGKFVKGKSGNPAGKPAGIPNKRTIERKIVEQEFKDRILFNIQDLLTAQLNIAKGTSYLYKIVYHQQGTKSERKEHILVTDPIEIKDFLDELQGDVDGILEDTYYYIATKQPDNRALDSLMDRVFGRAIQPMDLSSGGEPIGVVFLPMRRKEEDKQLEDGKLETPTTPTNSS